MNNLVDLFTEVQRVDRRIAWGEVMGTSPTLVRFAGDTADTQIALALSTYTPTVNDTVLVVKAGVSWVIVGDIV